MNFCCPPPSPSLKFVSGAPGVEGKSFVVQGILPQKFRKLSFLRCHIPVWLVYEAGVLMKYSGD